MICHPGRIDPDRDMIWDEQGIERGVHIQVCADRNSYGMLIQTIRYIQLKHRRSSIHHRKRVYYRLRMALYYLFTSCCSGPHKLHHRLRPHRPPAEHGRRGARDHQEDLQGERVQSGGQRSSVKCLLRLRCEKLRGRLRQGRVLFTHKSHNIPKLTILDSDALITI